MIIINNQMLTGRFSKKCKISHISPISKVNKPETTANHSPISVLTIILEVYQRVILYEMTLDI